MEEKTEERGRGCMTTLCYIEKDDSYLMMHRTVKKNDVNKVNILFFADIVQFTS